MKFDPLRLAWLFQEAGMIDPESFAESARKQGRQSKGLLAVLKQDVSVKSFLDLQDVSLRGIRDLLTMEIDLPFSAKGGVKKTGSGSIHEALSQPLHLSDEEAKAILNSWKPPLDQILSVLQEADQLKPDRAAVQKDIGTGAAAYGRLIEREYLQPRAMASLMPSLKIPLKKRNRLTLALSLLKFNDALDDALCEKILLEFDEKGEESIPQLNEEIAAFISSDPDMPDVNLEELHPPENLRQSLPVSFMSQNLVVPIRRTKVALEVATPDPFYLVLIDILSFLTGQSVLPYYAPASGLIGKINEMYHTPSEHPTAERAPAPARTPVAAAPAAPREKRIEEVADSRSAVELVSSVIEGGIQHRATDIHLEPHENTLRVRYRIDGRLRTIMKVPPALVLPVTSRIKVLANLDVTERRHPQDGHFSLNIGMNAFDFRVSTLPTHIGEKTVIRILDESRVMHSLADLGMAPEHCTMVQKWIGRPHGLLLVTGPTGSGKTSTLYAALNTINGDEKNIVTIEDPVEYRLQGINQVNVDPNIELGFASGLRAILRQDPDVIMVGEVRDMETAKIAMRAALTGHLVFSTLHTNTAVGAIATLGQMGIEPYMVVSAISGVISQRLVRALCQDCKKAFTPKSDVLANLKITGSTRKRMFRAVGCPACLQTGYHGRTGLFELMPMNEKIGGAILSRQSEGDIVARAREAGCASLLDNAIRKLYEGVTSPEEIVETVFIEE